eukprot:Tamp_08843.p3 GENE.Tamp_08843~~Tamp_08843.p3  ORF type:complete len:171 (-),score=17.48 Tamp_08843:959-1471(-)
MHEEDLSTLEARCEILENNELIRNARSQGRSFGGKDPERRASANPSQSHSKSLTDERGHSPIRHHGHSPTRHHRHSPTRHHNHRNQKLDLAEVMTEWGFKETEQFQVKHGINLYPQADNQVELAPPAPNGRNQLHSNLYQSMYPPDEVRAASGRQAMLQDNNRFNASFMH